MLGHQVWTWPEAPPSVHFWANVLNTFTPKSDQCQISPAASPEILHHTVWRTWLFKAYSDERRLYYQISQPHLYILLFERLGEWTFWTWEYTGRTLTGPERQLTVKGERVWSMNIQGWKGGKIEKKGGYLTSGTIAASLQSCANHHSLENLSWRPVPGNICGPWSYRGEVLGKECDWKEIQLLHVIFMLIWVFFQDTGN